MPRIGPAWRLRHEWAARVALVLLGLALSLPLLELGLQVGALVNRHALAPGTPEWLAGYRRVLAVGDSNTFGLGVLREAAYPQVLERLWNGSQRTPGRIQLLNAGYPGMTSASVRDTMPRFLRAFAPDLVLVMVGANDAWTAFEPIATGGDGDGIAPDQRWWRATRVYRLAFMLGRWLEHPMLELRDVDPEGRAGMVRYGDVEFSVAQASLANPPNDSTWRRLRENLRTIALDAGRHGSHPYLLTYPEGRGWVHRPANQAARDTARAAALPLIDVNAVFEPRCRDGCPDLIIPNDTHPTTRGHLLAAKTILHALVPTPRPVH